MNQEERVALLAGCTVEELRSVGGLPTPSVTDVLEVLIEHQDMTDRSSHDGCSCGEEFLNGAGTLLHIARQVQARIVTDRA